MTQRIKWRSGEHEIEIEGDAEFIGKYMDKFILTVESRPKETNTRHHALGPLHSNTNTTTQQSSATKPVKELTPAEFMRQKTPKNGTETLLVLGKYLEDYRGSKNFGGKEIKQLATEAKIKDVHSQYFTSAVQQGLLRQNGPGKYSLTISGEDCVQALPGSTSE